MGHLQTVEAQFRSLIADGDEEALVRFVKEQVLASYRNGLAAKDAVPTAGKRRTADTGTAANAALPRGGARTRTA